MNIYLISQTDTVLDDNYYYGEAVVCAPDEETARNMNPATGEPINHWPDMDFWVCDPARVEVKYLGIADASLSPGIISASLVVGEPNP